MDMDRVEWIADKLLPVAVERVEHLLRMGMMAPQRYIIGASLAVMHHGDRE